MKLIFLSDSFTEDFPRGGAEICCEALIKKLRGKHEVEKIYCCQLTNQILDENEFFIISHFFGLPATLKEKFLTKKFIKFEHDCAFNKFRDVSQYPNFVGPKSDIVNFDFYKNAHKVVLQSKRHLEVTKMNLGLDNLFSCGNLWDESDLQELESLQGVVKNDQCAVLHHPFSQKNTKGAVDYCLREGIKFNIIYPQEHSDFLRELARFRGLVFLPQVFETFSRVCCEARCLGLEVLANQNVSYFFEEYSHKTGLELIQQLRENNEKILELFEFPV